MPGPCGTPSKALLDWAAMALAPHEGPITASAVVFAATTASGDWYVIGIDRAYVHDNGTLAGGRSRDLGLTNAVKRRTADSKVIPLGGERKGVMSVSWDSVSWNDDKLSAGEAAVDQAITCLDTPALSSSARPTAKPRNHRVCRSAGSGARRTFSCGIVQHVSADTPGPFLPPPPSDDSSATPRQPTTASADSSSSDGASGTESHPDQAPRRRPCRPCRQPRHQPRRQPRLPPAAVPASRGADP